MTKKTTLLLILPQSPFAGELCGLLARDCSLIRAEDENEGLRILDADRKKIDAVLLALDLEKKTISNFLREFRSNILYAAIPIIGVLPRPLLPEDMVCLEQGASDIITPSDLTPMLTRRIANVVRAKDSATFYEIERMLQALPSNIFLKDAEGKYVFATHYWHHLDKSDDPNWTIRGKTDIEIRKDRDNAILAQKADKRILATGKGAHYVIEVNEDGQQEFLELIKEPVRDDSGKITGIIALINNVTEQHLLKQELEKRSRTDDLTGFFNRRYFKEYIQQMRKQKDIYPVSFISADCNGLKRINDTFGHQLGDEYLRMSAMLFRMVMPETAQFFRVGGDEFFIVLPRTSREETQALIAEIETQRASFRIKDQELSIALGFSTIWNEADSIRTCIEEADQNMYENKRKSKRARQ